MKSDRAAWSDIRVFLAVAREGSTLAASRCLGQSQPTVARRIDALEHATGLTLFERDTRGFRLTEAGRALLPEAEAMEAAAVRFGAAVAGQKALRPIRITAFAANLAGQATEIFTEFARLRPDITFEFLAGARVFDLMAGEADIALRLAFSPLDPDLICRHISEARFTVFASPDYIAAHGRPRSPADLASHRVLTYRRDDMAPTMHDWLVRQVGQAEIAQVFSETDLLYAAILSGQGIGLGNVRMQQKNVDEGRLVPCFDPPDELTAPHVLLVSPEAWRRPEVKDFVAFFAPRYAALYRD